MILFASTALQAAIDKGEFKQIADALSLADVGHQLNVTNECFEFPNQQILKRMQEYSPDAGANAGNLDQPDLKTMLKNCIAFRDLITLDQLNEILSFGFKFYNKDAKANQELLFYLASKLLGVNVFRFEFRAAMKTRVMANFEQLALPVDEQQGNRLMIDEFVIMFVVAGLNMLLIRACYGAKHFKDVENFDLIKNEILTAIEMYKIVRETTLCLQSKISVSELAKKIIKQAQSSKRDFVIRGGPKGHTLYLVVRYLEEKKLFRVTIYNYGEGRDNHSDQGDSFSPKIRTFSEEDGIRYITGNLQLKTKSGSDDEWEEIVYGQDDLLAEQEASDFYWPLQLPGVENCVSHGYFAHVKSRSGLDPEIFVRQIMDFDWSNARVDRSEAMRYSALSRQQRFLPSFDFLLQQSFTDQETTKARQQTIKYALNYLTHCTSRKLKLTLHYKNLTYTDENYLQREIEKGISENYTFILFIEGDSKVAAHLKINEFLRSRNIPITENAFKNYCEGNGGWLLIFKNVVAYENVEPYIPSKNGYIIISSDAAVPHADFLVDVRNSVFDEKETSELQLFLDAQFGEAVLAKRLAMAFLQKTRCSKDGYISRFNALDASKSKEERAFAITKSEFTSADVLLNLNLCVYFDMGNNGLPAWFLKGKPDDDFIKPLIDLGIISWSTELSAYQMDINLREMVGRCLTPDYDLLFREVFLRLPKYSSVADKKRTYLDCYTILEPILYKFTSYALTHHLAAIVQVQFLVGIIERTIYFFTNSKQAARKDQYRLLAEKLKKHLENNPIAIAKNDIEYGLHQIKKLFPNLFPLLSATDFNNWYLQTVDQLHRGELPKPVQKYLENTRKHLDAYKEADAKNQQYEAQTLHLDLLLTYRTFKYSKSFWDIDCQREKYQTAEKLLSHAESKMSDPNFAPSELKKMQRAHQRLKDFVHSLSRELYPLKRVAAQPKPATQPVSAGGGQYFPIFKQAKRAKIEPPVSEVIDQTKAETNRPG